MALVLRLFVVEAFKIPSGSMIPTLLIGDHIFVNKLSYGVRLPVVNWVPLHWGGYERGDVIVFVNPQRRHAAAARPARLHQAHRRAAGRHHRGQGRGPLRQRRRRSRASWSQEQFAYYERLGDDGPWVAREGELFQETMLDPDGKHTVTHEVLRDPGAPAPSLRGPVPGPRRATSS